MQRDLAGFSSEFLSCLCGSERRVASDAHRLQFLSCLCGSELFDFCGILNMSFLSCLCGSEPLGVSRGTYADFSELPMRQ